MCWEGSEQEMEKTPVGILVSFHNMHNKGFQQGKQREESPLRLINERS